MDVGLMHMNEVNLNVINTTQPIKIMSSSNFILKQLNLRSELSFKLLGNVEWWLIML